MASGGRRPGIPLTTLRCRTAHDRDARGAGGEAAPGELLRTRAVCLVSFPRLTTVVASSTQVLREQGSQKGALVVALGV